MAHKKITPKAAVLALRPDAKLSPTRFFSGALSYRISVPEGYLIEEAATAIGAWRLARASLVSQGAGE